MLRFLLKKYYTGISISEVKPKLDIRTLSLMDIIVASPCDAGLSKLLDVLPMKYLLMPYKQISMKQAIDMVRDIEPFHVQYMLNKMVKVYLFDVIEDVYTWRNLSYKIKRIITNYVYCPDDESYGLLMYELNQLVQTYTKK